ncbi:outer membrane protein assembly factor BamB family protein [Acetivibrio cellulolyticus]|uniref:outer membrane protein assembly factor BamB family protein n=1 Tax=Acetivibrio cellulolyticus TaxID=35830 RepID=UPI0002481CB3|nr:PQQ-binding-like beta-propeller repeat protein [Acetivibrio cellulolyticus]
MNFFKALLITNIIILILIVPSFIVLDKYLARHNDTSVSNIIASPENSDSGVIDLNNEEPVATPSTAPTEKTISIPDELLPTYHGFKWEVLKDKDWIDTEKNISFPNPEKYNIIEGVTTFRGNNFRNAPSYGTAQVNEKKLEKVWSIKIGYIDVWTGVGWNGQPAIVKWSDDIRTKMNIVENKKNKTNLKEVIYGTLDGKIYFLDLDNGESTRNPINIGYPIKGSVSVDPRGLPLLYSGQGIEKRGGVTGKIGFRIFSLIDQKMLYFINGLENSAYRHWGAFDSTPLVDTKNDTLYECGENGILYSVKLNSNFDLSAGSVSINPEVLRYRYKSPSVKKLGTENSIAIYKNFSYFVDNSGYLQCVDLNTLSPVWVRNVTDDTDSTIAIEDLGGSNVSLYTACEVDHQGKNGYSYVRKINALTGELIWENKYQCTFSETNGGALASPIVGKNDISNLVIFNIAKSWNTNGGKLIAFDKETGKEVWLINMDRYCWSSPVDIYTKDGKSYIIQCDSGGYMHLIEGQTGNILDRIPLGGNVEGSPAVYDDMIVVGTRGQKIWGIKVK